MMKPEFRNRNEEAEMFHSVPKRSAHTKKCKTKPNLGGLDKMDRYSVVMGRGEPSIPVRLALEYIVAVSLLALGTRDHARDQVRGDEKRTPAFALADVDAFVGAGPVEALLVAADDDMAEGHRGGAAAQGSASAEEEMDEPAVNFEDAFMHPRLAAGEQSQRGHDQPQRSRRQNPQIDERLGERHGVSIHFNSGYAQPVDIRGMIWRTIVASSESHRTNARRHPFANAGSVARNNSAAATQQVVHSTRPIILSLTDSG